MPWAALSSATFNTKEGRKEKGPTPLGARRPEKARSPQADRSGVGQPDPVPGLPGVRGVTVSCFPGTSSGQEQASHTLDPAQGAPPAGRLRCSSLEAWRGASFGGPSRPGGSRLASTGPVPPCDQWAVWVPCMAGVLWGSRAPRCRSPLDAFTLCGRSAPGTGVKGRRLAWADRVHAALSGTGQPSGRPGEASWRCC